MRPITLLLFFSIIIFNSCKAPQNCPSEVLYKPIKMEVRIFDSEEKNSCNFDNSHIEIEENDTCQYEQLIFDVFIEHETDFIGCYTEAITEDTIKSIVVTTNYDYNLKYKIGDTLNNILNIKKIIGDEIEYCGDLNLFLDLKPRTDVYSRYRLFLTEPPLQKSLQGFCFFYEDFSGNRYTNTTNAFYVKP